MKFYRLSNGDIVLDNYISKAFQITTGIPYYNAPDLYSKFLYGLSMSGRAEKYEPSVAELFSGGHMAYAYALYRDKTGCTLQEARQRVNFMMEKYRGVKEVYVMTRRKIIFYNDMNNSYIVSEEYNGDKAEMEQFDLGSCDHTWPEFMEAMNIVDGLPDFLKTISWITSSYHATVNGIPLHMQANDLPGTRLSMAHTNRELYAMVCDMDEVWEVKRGVRGARLFDVSAIAPMTWNGKDVLDTDEFDYSTAMPGDYVTQAVVNDAVDCRSAVYMVDRCSQSGEPYSVKYDDRSEKARETYVTFRKVGGKWPNGIWEYCGHCFRGENKER